MRTLTGTAQNDIIYAANPNRMPSGTTERLIDVQVSFPDAGITAKTATITNLPAGYAINNGVQNGSNWTVQLDPLDPTHLQIELRYVLPSSSAQPDANGFLGSFNLNILFGTVDANGATHLYSGSQAFVIGNVTSASDVEITSADGKSTIYMLNAVPPGATISAMRDRAMTSSTVAPATTPFPTNIPTRASQSTCPPARRREAMRKVIPFRTSRTSKVRRTPTS